MFAVQLSRGEVDDQVGDQEAYRIELSGVRRFAISAGTESIYRIRFNDLWQGRPTWLLNLSISFKVERRIGKNTLLEVVWRSLLGHINTPSLCPFKLYTSFYS